jgi:hypothetical protein
MHGYSNCNYLIWGLRNYTVALLSLMMSLVYSLNHVTIYCEQRRLTTVTAVLTETKEVIVVSREKDYSKAKKQ